MYHSLAPSVGPALLQVLLVTSSSITIRWEPVKCIHRNGQITGYLVKYGNPTTPNTHILSVSENVNETNLLGLIPGTNYSIQVAAANTAGVGVYSEEVTVKTALERKCLMIFTNLNM